MKQRDINTKPKAVIFDFDFTLADSSHGVLECINSALNTLNLPIVSYEQVCKAIGLSLTDTFTFLTDQGTPTQNKEFSRLFIQRADEIMVDLTVVFPSVPETIKILKASGLSLGIVSTKYRHRIETILVRAKLLEYFDVIVGGEDVTSHKPDPAGTITAAKTLQTDPSLCVFVGDSVVDAETANRASMAFVAVLSGVTTSDAFKAYPFLEIIDGVEDLPKLLFEHIDSIGKNSV